MAIWTPSKRDKPARGTPMASLVGILDAATVGILAVYPDGRLAYENDTVEELLGYNQRELTERTLNDLLNADPQWIGEQLDVLGKGEPWSGNVSLRRSTGETTAFAVNAFPTRTTDGPAYIGLLHTGLSDDAVSERIPAAAAFALTTRELCAILLMCEGFADKEIANLLGTSVWTVNKEVGRILKKMSASSRTEACIRAIRANLIL